jgi:8-oxo-dGTP pyrophosphatase MutT (NUDIX family)
VGPPGCHLEAGETAHEAARRETWEETRVVVGNLTVVGRYEITRAPEPADSHQRYPPLSFIVMFAGSVEAIREFAPGYDSIDRALLAPAECERLVGDRLWVPLWRRIAGGWG